MTAKDFVRTLYRSRFVRFGFVGGLGFFVNEAALVLAQRLLHAGPHFGWFLAFLPSVVFTWWGNRTVTFAAASSRTVSGMAMEFCRFVATNSLGALANFVVYALMIGFAPFPLNVPYLALVAGVFVGLIFNFTLSKRLVFRS